MSCFGGRDEQIYLVELTVERLRLTADKYREDFADCPPVVKLKFIDFPVFVISRRNQDSSSSSSEPPSSVQKYDESEGLLYARLRKRQCLSQDASVIRWQWPGMIGITGQNLMNSLAAIKLPIPTSVYGHKTCNFNRTRVPAHMGWMWNQTDTVGKLKPRAGWRPGAISVTLRDILREAKEGFLKETRRPRSAPYRKDGDYYVTMYPIRPETSEVPRLDEPINPLQFKIVKSKDSLASSSTASDMEIECSPPAECSCI